MIDLSDRDAIKELDPKDVFGSTELFSSQCTQILQDAKNLSRFDKPFDNIILCGMGGSAYGGYVANSLFKYTLPTPLYSNNDYFLPGFASKKSVIIVSSYSGSTEEVLSCAKKAKERGLFFIGLTSGGKLASFLRENNAPSLTFDPVYNPSTQPRLGTGYMVFGLIVLLSSLGIISLSQKDLQDAIDLVRKESESIKSEAIQIAKQLIGTVPLILSADFLNGNAHILRNQFNETAKSFSAFEDIPELNHHLMEGFTYPENKKLMVLFLESSLYNDVYKKRIALTKDVVSKNSVSFTSFSAKGTTPLSNVLTTLSFGGYLSLFLALLYGQDPSLIPWVDYFKEKLQA